MTFVAMIDQDWTNLGFEELELLAFIRTRAAKPNGIGNQPEKRVAEPSLVHDGCLGVICGMCERRHGVEDRMNE